MKTVGFIVPLIFGVWIWSSRFPKREGFAAFLVHFRVANNWYHSRRRFGVCSPDEHIIAAIVLPLRTRSLRFLREKVSRVFLDRNKCRKAWSFLVYCSDRKLFRRSSQLRRTAFGHRRFFLSGVRQAYTCSAIFLVSRLWTCHDQMCLGSILEFWPFFLRVLRDIDERNDRGKSRKSSRIPAR